MDAAAQRNGLRGIRLLAAHIRSLDPEERQAQMRLDELLGVPLTRKLLFALATARPSRRAA
jgi:hypothetical protein